MILSNETVTVLKNFSYINDSLLFKPGNVIQTINPSSTVVGQATVAEEFPVEFAIYEMGKFLSALSLFPEREITFSREPFLTIGKGRSKIKYVFAEPSMIVAAPYKAPGFPDDYVELDVTADQFQTVLKACNVLQLPQISFKGDGSKLWILGKNIENPDSDKYELEVGETDQEFESIVMVDNLKLLNMSYKIKVTTSGIINFHNENIDYWIAASQLD